MGLFIDEPVTYAVLGLPCHVAPKFSTRITAVKSGDENRNRNWKTPLREFTFPDLAAEVIDYQALEDHWLVMGGPEASWPLRNPIEFASVPVDENDQEPETSGLDQPLGDGDGLTSTFQLAKQRTVGSARVFTQPIYLPVLDTIEVLMNGLLPAAVPGGFPYFGPYAISSISRPGGIVTFDKPVASGLHLTWGGLFDVEVRYASDDALAGIIHSIETSGATSLVFQEVRRC